MKKIVLLLFIVFAFIAVNAQTTKDVNDWVWSGCLFVECDGVEVCGDVNIRDTYWYNPDGTIKKYQERAKGELETIDGVVYTLSVVTNDMAWKWYQGIDKKGAMPDTYVTTWLWKKDGLPVGFSHQTWHRTINAKGEVTAELNNYVWECY